MGRKALAAYADVQPHDLEAVGIPDDGCGAMVRSRLHRLADRLAARSPTRPDS